jgi:cyanate permease
MDDRTAAASGAFALGLGYLLAGAALLLQELDRLTLRWTYLLPLILLTVGVVVLVTGLRSAHRSASS